jgi:hypothetical protein
VSAEAQTGYQALTQAATQPDVPVKIAPVSRWLLAIIGLLAVGIVAALLWVALANRAVVSGADQRNEADLAIATGGLEQWSEAITGMARASFIRGRVSPLPQSERDYGEKWRYRAWMRHPALDEFKINYAVTTTRDCDAIRNQINKVEGPLPFVDNYNAPGNTYLKFVGAFPLAQIWGQDTGQAASAANRTNLRRYLQDIVGKLAPDEQKPGIDYVVCYAAGIELQRLLVIDKAARAFSALMIVDHDRHIVARVGADRIPITSLNGLAPANSILTTTLAASLGEPSAPGQERKLADSLDPVDLNIAGRKYVAYVRPFAPRNGFDVCNPVAPAAALPTISLAVGSATATGVARAAPVPRTQAPSVDGTSSRAATGDCLVVALAPKATVWRQVIALPLVIGVSLGLAVLILIALLPSLRLILLGPGEAITRSEAVGVALGIPAVASLATLALLFMFDISLHRATARAEAASIAQHAALRAQRQIQQAIELVRKASVNAAPATFPTKVPPPTGIEQPSIVGCDTQADSKPRSNIDRLLAVNPRPVCRTVQHFCRYLPHSGLPVIDTINLFDEDGSQIAGSRMTVCRGFAAGRANISARDYFVRLRAGSDATRESGDSSRPRDGNSPLLDSPPYDAMPYVVDHVTALQDGIAKSIVALKAIPAKPDISLHKSSRPQPLRHRHQHNRKKASPGVAHTKQAAIGPLNPDDPRNRIFAVATTSLTEVVAPVLPPPYGLMIVDTRSNDLRVLLHPTPGRSGTETLARTLPDLASVRDRLRSLHEMTGGNEPVYFDGFYDGMDRTFVARPIAGTPWVAIVQYGLADVDAVAARTALQTLLNWAAFSILSVGAWLIWLLLTGRRGWPRLWPQGAREQDYDRLAVGFTLLGIAGGVFLVLSPTSGRLGAGTALFAGFGIRILAAVILHFVLGRPATIGKTKLRSTTQRSYMRMLAPLLLCLSVIPMGGFWLEARQYALMEIRQETFDYFLAPGGMLETNRLTFDRMRWAYGIIRQPAVPGAPIPGGYDVYVTTQTPAPADTHAAFFSRFFAALANDPLAVPIAGCPIKPASSAGVQLCRSGGQFGIEVGTPRPFRDWPDQGALYLLALLAVGLFFALRLILARVLRALAGFGIALNAVDPPCLFLGDLWGMPQPKLKRPPVVLNRKSLLVNAPWVVFAMLRGGVGSRFTRLDVADTMPDHAPMREGSIVVVTGLELVLADRARRLRALARLERMCCSLAELGAETKTRLIIMTESAPLERILDAFERDDSRPKFDAERENLRWSRLFEDFGTFSFDQPTLTSPLLSTKGGNIRRGKIAIINAVLEECRWLPPRIVNGGIGREILLGDDVVDTALVPIGDEIYQAKWRAPLIKWTLARNFPGRNAARAYLRNQFIEYYQRLWLSSTDAEHLVMHNMAHCRFVNIGAALAFTSLVRRGIVVLDPEPRLMNKSFAMFVRQAEKLGTIMEWRKAVPAGAWATARLPIFAVIGLALATLIGLLMISGEQTSALLPVLAAGLPAIVAATRRVLRQ